MRRSPQRDETIKLDEQLPLGMFSDTRHQLSRSAWPGDRLTTSAMGSLRPAPRPDWPTGRRHWDGAAQFPGLQDANETCVFILRPARDPRGERSWTAKCHRRTHGLVRGRKGSVPAPPSASASSPGLARRPSYLMGSVRIKALGRRRHAAAPRRPAPPSAQNPLATPVTPSVRGRAGAPPRMLSRPGPHAGLQLIGAHLIGCRSSDVRGLPHAAKRSRSSSWAAQNWRGEVGRSL